jgi:uncharacterized protein DUF5994
LVDLNLSLFYLSASLYRRAGHSGQDPSLHLVLTTGISMASLTDHAQVRLEPVHFRHTTLDGTWSPRSDDPLAELPGLIAALEQAGGPLVRLLLSVVGWTSRPHEVTVGDRVVSLGYFCDRPPALLTAVRADGSTITLLISAG